MNLLRNTFLQTLDDVIRLKCETPEKKGHCGEQEAAEKPYTYTELKDLQSRLALVAGDKQRESADCIQQFDEVRNELRQL